MSVIKKLMSIEVSIPLSSRTKHTQKTRILESYNSYEKVQITNCWSIIEGTPHLVITALGDYHFKEIIEATLKEEVLRIEDLLVANFSSLKKSLYSKNTRDPLK